MTTPVTYDFGEDFQTLVLGYLFRDVSFNVRTDGLIKPEYFTTEIGSALAAIGTDYYRTYKNVPSRASMNMLLKDAFDRKLLRPELKAEIIEVVREAFDAELKDEEYVAEQVTKFAKKQELTHAILKCADLIDKNDFDPVEGIITKATLVGQHEDAEQYDFWQEADNRMKHRQAIISGLVKPDGITTGFKDFDNALYHKGWGRKELTVLMGPAKSGKSMALVTFAMKAALAGSNVLYVSLEVAKNIIADRLEANLSGVRINDLGDQMKKAHDASIIAASRAGILKVHDYASGTFQPNQLRRLLHRYAANGIKFDLVIVDYADLMAPDRYTQEPRENSRMVYVGLRGVAHEFNCALLSATQTNRAGFSAALGKMEHVAEDINKVRTVDLMISLNRDDTDKSAGEARLYLAASRNQQEVIVRVKADIGTSRYIESILEVIT